MRDVKRRTPLATRRRTIGQWNDPDLDAGPAHQLILLPTGKVLWFAYPEKDTWYQLAHGKPANEDVNWAEAYVFDPAPARASGATRRSTPDTGKPFNIWCAGQTLLRDGRVVVAGGNFHYYWLGGSTSTRASTSC